MVGELFILKHYAMKKTILLVLLAMIFNTISAQEGIYKISFKDKDQSKYTTVNPSDFLSEDALARRAKENIAIVDSDLPIPKSYIKAIHENGFDIVLKSKWFNCVFINAVETESISALSSLSFVESVEFMGKATHPKSDKNEKFGEYSKMYYGYKYDFDYGNSLLQNAMIKADSLHELGYTGEGIKIAVLDAGFMGVDTIGAFGVLYDENRVLGVKDFVANDNVYAHSGHGTAVLSQMAAMDEGNLIGTAPGASYYLLRTEDSYAEYLLEEYFWAAGAEYADSAGVHIINSSLGYSEFDEPSQNHSYADMDGATTPVTLAAEMAASKGIVVVTSAGNEGDGDWHYITAPGDAPNAITVGAVKTDSLYAAFSSVGPTADGRIKPDVVALGQGNLVSTPTGGMTFGSGTSFASPLVAGLTACIMQACPGKNAANIRDALRNSSSNAGMPSYFLGYGITNGVGAISELLGNYNFTPDDDIIIYPNPVSEFVNYFTIYTSDEVQSIEIFNTDGRQISPEIEFIPGIGARIHISSNSQSGIYLVKITANNSISTNKVVIR